jgi:hypothetical protein
MLGRQRVQLAVDIAPLAHAQRREEILVARLDQLALRLAVFDLGLIPVPEPEPGEKLRLLVGELAVRRVGRSLPLLRPLARVLHRQCGGDHQHLAQAALVAGGDDHPPEPRIERHLRQFLAGRRQRMFGRHRTEFEQQLVTVADRLARRRLEEGKILDVAQTQRLHAQDHAGQRRAHDLRVGVRRPQGEILLFVEADAHPRRHPAAAPGTLVGRSLGDLLDLQLLDLVAIRVALDARQPRIDDVADSRHGQRGLGDVGRQHDAAADVRLEDAALLLGRQAGKQGQDLGVRRVVLAQRLGRLADLALARQEDQHVARPDAMQLVAGVGDRIVEIALVVGCGVARRVLRPWRLLQRAITQLDRKQPARNLDHRRAAEVLRKALGIDRRRGDDQLQVAPLRQQLLEIAEQEVDVQAALVRLVDDQRVVLFEPGVALRLGEQDAVGHQLDEGIGRAAVAETDLVADQAAGFALQLLRDARRRCPRGDPPRLRVADQASRSAAEFETDLRDLRRLARAGFAADDDHGVLRDQRRDFVAASVDRQVVGKLRFRQARPARRDGRARSAEQLVALRLQRIALAAEEVPQVARHRPQTALIARQAVGEGVSRQGWHSRLRRRGAD